MKNFSRRMTFTLNLTHSDHWLAQVGYSVPPVKRKRQRPAGVRVVADGTVVWHEYHDPRRLDGFTGQGAVHAKAKEKVVVEAFGGARLGRVWVIGLGSGVSLGPTRPSLDD